MKRILIILIFMLQFFACSWTPKTVLPDDFRVVHIPKFGNDTLQPQLVESFTKKVVEKFELDGRLIVTEHVSKAHGVLFCTITKYKKAPVTYTERGELDVNALSVSVSLKLRQIKNGEWLHDTVVEDTIEFNFKSEPVETELDAQTRVIESLSDKIVSKTIEGW